MFQLPSFLPAPCEAFGNQSVDVDRVLIIPFVTYIQHLKPVEETQWSSAFSNQSKGTSSRIAFVNPVHCFSKAFTLLYIDDLFYKC